MSSSASPSATATRLKRHDDPFLRMIRAERSRLLASATKHSSPERQRRSPTSPVATVTQRTPASTGTMTRTSTTTASNFTALTHKYEERLDEMLVEIQTLRAEKEQQHGVLQTTLQDHAKLEQEVKRLQSTLDKERERRTALEKCLEVAQNHEKRVASLETALSQETKRSNDAKAAVETLQEKVRQSEETVHQSEEKVAVEQSFRLEAEENLEKAQKQIRDLDGQLEQVGRLQEKVEHESKLRRQAQTELEALQKTLQYLENEREAASEEEGNEPRSPLALPLRVELFRTKEELQRVVSSRDDNHKTHLEQMDHIHEQLQTVSSQRDSSIAKLEATQKDLEQSKEMIEALNDELADVREQLEASQGLGPRDTAEQKSPTRGASNGELEDDGMEQQANPDDYGEYGYEEGSESAGNERAYALLQMEQLRQRERYYREQDEVAYHERDETNESDSEQTESEVEAVEPSSKKQRVVVELEDF